VCVTLRTPQSTTTAVDGEVAEAGKQTPSCPGTAPFPSVIATTVAGGWVGAGKYSTAVGGTPRQLMNGTAARGWLATELQWRVASQLPCQ